MIGAKITRAHWLRLAAVLLLLGLAACQPAADSSLPPLPTPWSRPPEVPLDLPSPTPETLPPPGNGLDPALVESLPGAGEPVVILPGQPEAARAQYYPPAGGGAAAGLVLLPMQGANPAAWGGLQAAAQQAGFAVLALELDYGGLPGSARRLDTQARAALEWLAEQPEVDPARLQAVGASLGANLAVRLAAAADLQGLALLSPVSDGYGLALPASAQTPIWLAAATEDQFSRPVEDLSAYALEGSFTSLQPSGAAHGANLLAEETQLQAQILAWLAER